MESMGKVNKKFWKNKKVLLTGHTGFKGSWLSLWLNQMGANVVGYALEAPTDPSLFELFKLSQNMKSIIGDVRDLKKLTGVFQNEKPEIVIHLAGQPIVSLSYDDPILTYTTNVIGTANILEAVRLTNSVKSVVCITSDKCYENVSWVWGYRENDRLGGNDPYSSSKASAELVIKTYTSSYFSDSKKRKIGVASARAGNVIGGGDWAKDRLVPDIIRSFIEGKEVIIRNPNATRPWQHVLEPLSGYLILAEKLYQNPEKFTGAWNFGPDQKVSKPVSVIVDKLVSLWGGSASWNLDNADHPHEDLLLSLDSSKSSRFLDWNTKLNLDQTIEWIVDWYKEFQNKGDLRKITFKQISEYQKI